MEHLHAAGETLDATSIARWRELLGREAEELSDQDVDEVRLHADAIACVVIEAFLQQRATKE